MKTKAFPQGQQFTRSNALFLLSSSCTAYRRGCAGTFNSSSSFSSRLVCSFVRARMAR